jgi:hypothetical protein
VCVVWCGVALCLCSSINGVSYLVADMSQECFSSTWFQYLPLALVAVLVYPVGIPVALFLALRSVRKRLKTPEVITAFGLCYEAYAPQYWWFEIADVRAPLFSCAPLVRGFRCFCRC